MNKEFPILEFDSSTKAIINPSILKKIKNVPKAGVLCFFQEVIINLEKDGKIEVLTNLKSEMGNHPVYKLTNSEDNKTVIVFHPGIGAPLAGGLFEELIALGCENFIACGGAGVLDKEIIQGQVIIPNSGIRDEGTSYHYLPASREVQPSQKALQAIEYVLHKHQISYILGKTWTTDAFYRETINKIKLRKLEGCLTVEMEFTAFCAIAKFRGVHFG
jgi:uridine phosphorylase